MVKFISFQSYVMEILMLTMVKTRNFVLIQLIFIVIKENIKLMIKEKEMVKNTVSKIFYLHFPFEIILRCNSFMYLRFFMNKIFKNTNKENALFFQ